MSLPPLREAEEEEERRRQRLARIVRVSMIVILGGCALWLVLELDKARRAQNCLESGSRKCAIIQTR